MLAAVITGPCYLRAEEVILEASKWADFIEVRLETFPSIDVEAIARLQKFVNRPFILKATSDYRALAALKPSFIDIDFFSKERVSIEEIRAISPRTQIIISYHNFDLTPTDLEEIYQQMEAKGADYIKIATYCVSSLDALRLMTLRKHGLITVAMGPNGQFARLMAPIIGQPFAYALTEEGPLSKLGLLTYDELERVYGYKRLNRATKVFALIGAPVAASYSYITHNRLFQDFNLNALFVRIEIQPDELEEFFRYRHFFEGLAVTLPHKEHVFRFLTEIEGQARAMGAVNTITGTKGANTDCEGALEAIEKKIAVKGKKIVIIGCGGSARAIAYEAQQRGATVVMVGRNEEKVRKVAFSLDCESDHDLKDHLDYDILVNATPVGMFPHVDEIPIDPSLIMPNRCLFDVISNPKKTTFLREGEKKGCIIVSGLDMFLLQALGQFKRWLSVDPHIARAHLEKIFEELVVRDQSEQALPVDH